MTKQQIKRIMKTVAVLTFSMKSKGGKTYTCNMGRVASSTKLFY